jgi:hypothetical protein
MARRGPVPELFLVRLVAFQLPAPGGAKRTVQTVAGRLTGPCGGAGAGRAAGGPAAVAQAAWRSATAAAPKYALEPMPRSNDVHA